MGIHKSIIKHLIYKTMHRLPEPEAQQYSRRLVIYVSG